MTKKWAVICVLVLGVSVFAGCIQIEDHSATDSLASLPSEPHQGAEAITMEENRTDPANAYNDSEPRYHNVVDGREKSVRTIDIPLGAETLRVALIHDSEAAHNGEVRFRLQSPSPLSQTIADDNTRYGSEKYMDEPDWVVIHDPLPGSWKLRIDIRGVSSYTIGVYLE